MGRLVTSFSYPQHSAMDHIMRKMREKNQNISEVITDIIENHYDLYETSRQQTEELGKLARILSCHTQAAQKAGLTLVNNPYALGWTYKQAMFRGEEE